ncbi:MAG TPA: hypothetical protein VKU40_12940 [Thermoanaerobaculia bacterium]|nr:hypothetical protein [Thermoanaerobaculia bacterium]
MGRAERCAAATVVTLVACAALAATAAADEAANGPSRVETATARLAAAGAGSDPFRVAADLDVLRAAGPAARPVAPVVAALLPYRHPLYRDRDKLLVVRLRAYLVVTLAEIGAAEAALPALEDSLGNVDEQSAVLELAAAARASRSLGPRGRPFIPYLLEAITLRRASEEISLERFAPEVPAGEATTVQLEAVAALAELLTPEDREEVASLTNVAEYRADGLDRRLVEAARAAVERIAGAER